MIDVNNLDKTINEFEKEVDNIKNISSIVTNLNKVAKEVVSNKQDFKDITDNLHNVKQELLDKIKTYDKLIDDTMGLLEQVNKTIDSRIKNIQDENLSFNKKLGLDYQNIENDLLSHIQDIRKESNKLLLDYQEVIDGKLDRNKSDLVVQMRDNSKEIIEDINKSINQKSESILTQMSKNSEAVKKKLKVQNILLIIIMIIGIANVAVKFI